MNKELINFLELQEDAIKSALVNASLLMPKTSERAVKKSDQKGVEPTGRLVALIPFFEFHQDLIDQIDKLKGTNHD